MRKLEVSVQSGGWYDERKPEEGIRYIKECGFEGIDYNINNLFTETFDEDNLTSFFDKDMNEIREYYAPLKQAMEQYDVSISQFHGLFPMYYPEQDKLNDYFIQVTEKMLAICEYLNCKAIVIHPWSGPDLTKEEERNINLSIFRKLISGAKKYGVTICLENLFKHDHIRCFEGACSEAEEVCWYIDALNEEAGEEIFGFCFDVGHANVLGKNIYQYLNIIGKRLTVLHIHDNDSTTDSHMIPYTQRDVTGKRSTVKWEQFLKALAEIEYEGPIAFETFGGLCALPPEVQKEGLQLISAIGRYFRTSINERRRCK